MTSTEQLERETEQKRARLGETIDELREMTPGRILDEILDYAKDGGGELVRRMGQQVADNPAPAIMIGAGLVWMITGTGKLSTGSPQRAGISNGNQSSLGSAAQGVKELAQGVGAGMSHSVSALTDQASSAYDTVAGKASQAADGFKETAASVTNSTMAMEQRILEATRGLVGFCKDQPLVLAGLGLALGAALGAAVPETQAEDRAMGEMSDQLKEHVNTLASEQLDTAKRIGGHVLDESTKVLKQELGDAAKNLPPEEMAKVSDQTNFSPIEEPNNPAWNGGDDNLAISH